MAGYKQIGSSDSVVQLCTNNMQC